MTRLALSIFASFAIATLDAQSPVPPPWAYTVNPPSAPGAKPAPPSPEPRTIPGSALSLTVAQTRDAFNPPDWFPETHPPMPESVAHGRPRELRACGFCHLVNGQGRPENASLAGLPAAYIIQQMADFKSGVRRDYARMNGIAKAMTDEEIRQAAQWFASLPRRRFSRVVEAAMVQDRKSVV